MLSFKTVVGAACAFVLIGACSTLSQSTRVPSPFAASTFNSVASQYMERPTFLSVQTFSDGTTALKVLMDEYGTRHDPATGMPTEHATYFDQRFVESYIALIDKYLEWEALAMQRGDLVEREIGLSKTRAQVGTLDLKFRMYSARTDQHLLAVETCAFGGCTDITLYLTRPNAQRFRQVLSDFADGKLGGATDDSIYK